MVKKQEKKSKVVENQPMVMVVCIFRRDRLEQFKKMSKDLDLPGATISKVIGFGRQKGHIELFRGDEYEVEFIEKLKAEIVILKSDTDKVLDGVRDFLRTGRIGDGKVFIIPVESSMRIRTGEQGSAAI